MQSKRSAYRCVVSWFSSIWVLPLLLGCGVGSVSLDGKKCDSHGQCTAGYVCNSAMLCVSVGVSIDAKSSAEANRSDGNHPKDAGKERQMTKPPGESSKDSGTDRSLRE